MFSENKTNGLFFSLIVIFWLWMDFVGLLLSVISTYFYFGWAGTPQLVLKIFLIALFAFSGPIWYRLIGKLHTWPITVRLLITLTFGIYLLMAFVRHSDIFAWAAVLGAFVSGLALVAILDRLRAFQDTFMPFFSLLFGFLIYMLVRLFNHGLATLFSGHILSWLMLGGLVFATLLTGEPVFKPRTQKASMTAQVLAIALGLLIGTSVGLIFNLHIWSAKTPNIHAAVYLFSFGMGTLPALLLLYFLKTNRLIRMGLLLASCSILAYALYIILYQPYSLMMGLGAHTAGCMGLTFLWGLFLQRYGELTKKQQMPLGGLQIGFIAFLMILTLFLLQANPNGFWLALGLSALSIGWAELRGESIPTPPFQPVYIGLISVLLILILPAIFYLKAPAETGISHEDQLTVMSSNIRYGWTDDYRYMPHQHAHWLKNQIPVDILGLQEVNKGHTSASYMDLYNFYQYILPGNWRYGDANYGFGNALMSRLKIKRSEVRTYQAKDMLQRSCLWALVEWNGQEIEVFVTHLSHLPPPNPVRQAQIHELLKWLQATQHPWILLGDFNARPQDPEIQSLLPIVHPVFRKTPELLQQPSFPSLNPQERIDYIYFSADFELLEQRILDNQGTSDHKPVYSRLRLK